MNETTYSIPKRDSQHEALKLLGVRLAENPNLSQKDLNALIAEYMVKPPAEAEIGHTAAKDINLLAAKTQTLH